MKKHILLFIFLVTVSTALSNQSHSDKKEVIFKTQKVIIEELAGAKALKNGDLIQNRSSSKNKRLARAYLQELIQNIGLEPEVQKYSMPNVNPLVDILFNPFKGANVFATLPSTTNSDEYLILGAHYDTELDCPGAIDNATGVALIYEVFYELSKLDQRQKNVIVVFFDQEEEDLVGSQAFVKYIKSNKLNIHSVHTFDTMGWDKDGDRAVEIELPTPYLEEVYKKNALQLNIPLHLSPCNSTDHHSFRVKGFNAVGLTDEYYNGDYPPLKDTPEDKFHTVNFEYLKSSTQLVRNTIAEIIK